MYSYIQSAPFYDVKFYPYTPPGVDPVFAVTGDRSVSIPLVSSRCGAESFKTVVCRVVLARDNAIEIIRWFKDDDDAVSISFVRHVCGLLILCVLFKRHHSTALLGCKSRRRVIH